MNLRRKMQVADFPGDERCLIGRGEGDFINPLGKLADEVVTAILLENDTAIDEAVFQIESELGAIFGHTTPTTFQEIPSLGEKDHLLPGREPRFFREHVLDEMHRRSFASPWLHRLQGREDDARRNQTCILFIPKSP